MNEQSEILDEHVLHTQLHTVCFETNGVGIRNGEEKKKENTDAHLPFWNFGIRNLKTDAFLHKRTERLLLQPVPQYIFDFKIKSFLFRGRI